MAIVGQAQYDSGTLAQCGRKVPVGSLVDMVQWSPKARLPPSTDAAKMPSVKEQSSTFCAMSAPSRRSGKPGGVAFSPLALLKGAMVGARDKGSRTSPMDEGLIARRSEMWNVTGPERSSDSPESGRRSQVKRKPMDEDHSISNIQVADENAKKAAQDEAVAEQKKAKEFHSPPSSSTVKLAAFAPATVLPSACAVGTEDAQMSCSECPHVSDSTHMPVEDKRVAATPLPVRLSCMPPVVNSPKSRRSIPTTGPYAPGPYKPIPLSKFQSEELAKCLNALGEKGARMKVTLVASSTPLTNDEATKISLHATPGRLKHSSSAPLLHQPGATA